MPRALTQMPQNDTNDTQMTLMTLNPIFVWIDFPYRKKKKKNSNFVSFERGQQCHPIVRRNTPKTMKPTIPRSFRKRFLCFELHMEKPTRKAPFLSRSRWSRFRRVIIIAGIDHCRLINNSSGFILSKLSLVFLRAIFNASCRHNEFLQIYLRK